MGKAHVFPLQGLWAKLIPLPGARVWRAYLARGYPSAASSSVLACFNCPTFCALHHGDTSSLHAFCVFFRNGATQENLDLYLPQEICLRSAKVPLAGEVSRVYQLAVFDLIEVKVGTTAEMAADIQTFTCNGDSHDFLTSFLVPELTIVFSTVLKYTFRPRVLSGVR